MRETRLGGTDATREKRAGRRGVARDGREGASRGEHLAETREVLNGLVGARGCAAADPSGRCNFYFANWPHVEVFRNQRLSMSFRGVPSSTRAHNV